MGDKITWQEAVQKMREFNAKHGITTKGGSSEPQLVIVAVISPDSFNKEYTEEQRSYAFSNHNKAFLPAQSSNSIFAECLDQSEYIRLSEYIYESIWKVDYCYVLEDSNLIV